jgi:hypothetical protein
LSGEAGSFRGAVDVRTDRAPALPLCIGPVGLDWLGPGGRTSALGPGLIFCPGPADASALGRHCLHEDVDRDLRAEAGRDKLAVEVSDEVVVAGEQHAAERVAS